MAVQLRSVCWRTVYLVEDWKLPLRSPTVSQQGPQDQPEAALTYMIVCTVRGFIFFLFQPQSAMCVVCVCLRLTIDARRHRWEGEVEREVVLLHVIAVPRSDHLWIFKSVLLHVSLSLQSRRLSPVLTAVLAQKLVVFF